MADRKRTDAPSEARIAALTHAHSKLDDHVDSYPADQVAELMVGAFVAGIDFAATKVGEELARPTGCEFEVDGQVNGTTVLCGAPPTWSTDCGGGKTLLCTRHKDECAADEDNVENGVEFFPIRTAARA
jgi:hypothetical protein